MFNLIKLIIGGALFFTGITTDMYLCSFLITMVGSFILSRPFALDSGFGNTPALFLVGIIIFIPSFFLLKDTLVEFGFKSFTSEVIRITVCLFSGVLTFLSICKK